MSANHTHQDTVPQPAPDARAIDFIIIGAQKSGTTSLFEYLTSHPNIFMPGAKELEFFSDPKRYAKGYDWYYKAFFAKAPAESILGEASTHYMMYPDAPSNILTTLPDIKLLAILRNPLERALSHYRMTVMRGRENGTFREAISSRLNNPSAPLPSDPYQLENFSYVEFGEYGRILESYIGRFDRSRIKVIFMDDLERNPVSLMQDIYAFLGVSRTHTPPNAGKRYNVTGKKIIPGLDNNFRKALSWAWKNRVFRRLMTRARYERLMFWSFTEFNIKKEEAEKMERDIQQALIAHFKPDMARLEALLGIKVPWKEFQ
jgi:hypothetical protein